jgi:N-acetylmuramoyl-L-alanine amidase
LVAAIVALDARPGASREVTAVRYWSLADTTRVAIRITGDVRYRSNHVGNPNRIFVDFVGARPHIKGRRSFSTEVDDKLLKGIRVAESSPGVTRVVLDLESAADYAVSRLHNPSRLIIELRPAAMSRTVNDTVSPPQAGRELERVPEPVVTDGPSTPLRQPLPQPYVIETPGSGMNAKVTSAPGAVLPEPPAASSTPPRSSADDTPAEASRALSPPVVPKAAHTSSDGERSMIRALGLKINRVVVDPGHGGSDQGTIGQGGLKEGMPDRS